MIFGWSMLMPDGITATLVGVQELELTFKRFKDETKTKVAKSALRTAAKKTIFEQALRNVAQLNDPNTANDISKNLMLRFNSKSFRRTGNMSFSIGVRGGAKKREENQLNPGGDTFYWRFLEFGTKHVQRLEPITKAAESQAAAFYALFRIQLSKKMMAEAKRQSKRRAGRSGAQNFRRGIFGLGD
jgi:HK97 gp10 family phage protein